MRKKTEEFICVTEAKIGAEYRLITDDELSVVLRDGCQYLSSRWPDRRVRKGDLITVLASYSDDELETADLVVTAAGRLRQRTGGILL